MKVPLYILPAYDPVERSEKRYKRLQGGGGSGKSIAVAKIILLRTLKFPNQRRFCFRKVGRTVKDSIFATFKDLIYEHGLEDYFSINRSNYSFLCSNGSEILCGGLDEPEKVKSIKDPVAIWMEEATEFTAADFLQLDLRLRKEGALLEFFLTYNPISKNNWLYKTFEVQRGYDELFIKTSYRDNPYLPDQYKDMLRSLETKSYNHYLVYTLGEWGEITKGLIFPDYEIVDKFPDGSYIYGLDFGFNDPMTIIKVGIRDPDAYLQEMFYESGYTVPEMIRKFPSMDIGYRDSIYYDSSRPGSGKEIRNARYLGAKPSIKGQGSISDGIDKMKDYNIKVVAGSSNLISELNKYRWDEDKEGNMIEGKPIDAYNHAIDATRYGIFTHTYKATAKPIHKSTPYQMKRAYRR